MELIDIFPTVYCNAERYNTFSPLPLIVLAGLSNRRRLVDLLSTKLLSPHLEADLLDSEEKEVMKNVEQEIECPRCSDIMTLSSDFDKLGYICQECELLLIMK